MDAMRGIDPTSSKFQTQAARNISQVGFGAVRTQKEIKQDDSEPEVRDQVKLSHQPSTPKVDTEDLTNTAAMSGELGELQDDLTEDGDEIARKRVRDQEDEMDEMGAAGRSSGLRTAQEVQRLKDMDDPSQAVHDILKDIPQRSLEPAKNIVAAQIQGSRPSEALTQPKPVEGVNAVDFQPETTLGILDIHDSHNQPMAQDPIEGVAPEQQRAMAGQQIDQMVANLPEDRKAVVDEMRTAVNAWAASQGVDPGAAFAEQLHSLAKGWDDESLKVASRTYADAAREVGSAAAAE
jgi:hypothetical protein